jgi:hypothetical protein
MNETKFEAQLRSLKLRQPSERIKRRLFPASTARNEFARALRWFAPVAACAAMAFAVLQREGNFRGDGSFRPAALVASNVAMIHYQPEVNRWPAIFEWTNRSDSSLSIGSFSPDKN